MTEFHLKLLITVLCISINGADSSFLRRLGCENWFKGSSKSISKTGNFGPIVDTVNTAQACPSSYMTSMKIQMLPQNEQKAIREFLESDDEADALVTSFPGFVGRLATLAARAASFMASSTVAAIRSARYGSQSPVAEVKMSPELILTVLQLTSDKVRDLEERTRRDRCELEEEKKLRLTAEYFGDVMLNKHQKVDEVTMGRFLAGESRAVPDFFRKNDILKSLQTELKVMLGPSGIFVDPMRGYLAAVPDAEVVGQDAIVKIHVLQEPKKKKTFEWDDKYELGKDRALYHEIQGLLNISDRSKCYLVVVTKKNLKRIIIQRNKRFWYRKMVPELEKFYINLLLPVLGAHKLPNVRDVKMAAYTIYASLLISKEEALQIVAKTQDDACYDTLMLESRVRIMARDFHIVCKPGKRTKQKVMEISHSHIKMREEWTFERGFQRKAIQAYADKNNLNYQVGGLYIDRTNRFLAAMPSAFARKKPTKTLRQMLSYDSDGPPTIRTPLKPLSFKGTDLIIIEAVSPVIRESTTNRPQETFLSMLDFLKESPQGEYSLKEDSKYYYEIQGSLGITRARTCIFMVVLPGHMDDPWTQEISFKPEFYERMLQDLKTFYFSAYIFYHANPLEFVHAYMTDVED